MPFLHVGPVSDKRGHDTPAEGAEPCETDLRTCGRLPHWTATVDPGQLDPFGSVPAPSAAMFTPFPLMESFEENRVMEPAWMAWTPNFGLFFTVTLLPLMRPASATMPESELLEMTQPSTAAKPPWKAFTPIL